MVLPARLKKDPLKVFLVSGNSDALLVKYCVRLIGPCEFEFKFYMHYYFSCIKSPESNSDGSHISLILD